MNKTMNSEKMASYIAYVLFGIICLTFYLFEDARMKRTHRRIESCHKQGGELYVMESGVDFCINIDAKKVFDAGE